MGVRVERGGGGVGGSEALLLLSYIVAGVVELRRVRAVLGG